MDREILSHTITHTETNEQYSKKRFIETQQRKDYKHPNSVEQHSVGLAEATISENGLKGTYNAYFQDVT